MKKIFILTFFALIFTTSAVIAAPSKTPTLPTTGNKLLDKAHEKADGYIDKRIEQLNKLLNRIEDDKKIPESDKPSLAWNFKNASKRYRHKAIHS